MTKLTNDDWTKVYDMANKAFKGGRYPHYITKDDFRQECALAVLKAQDKVMEAENRDGMLYMIVHYTKYKLLNTAYNRQHKKTMDQMMVTEFSEDAFEDISATEAYLDIDRKVQLEKHLVAMNDYLTNIEYIVCVETLHGRDLKDIAEQLELTQSRVSQLLGQAKQKISKRSVEHDNASVAGKK